MRDASFFYKTVKTLGKSGTRNCDKVICFYLIYELLNVIRNTERAVTIWLFPLIFYYSIKIRILDNYLLNGNELPIRGDGFRFGQAKYFGCRKGVRQ